MKILKDFVGFSDAEYSKNFGFSYSVMSYLGILAVAVANAILLVSLHGGRELHIALGVSCVAVNMLGTLSLILGSCSFARWRRTLRTIQVWAEDGMLHVSYQQSVRGFPEPMERECVIDPKELNVTLTKRYIFFQGRVNSTTTMGTATTSTTMECLKIPRCLPIVDLASKLQEANANIKVVDV